LLVSHDRTFLDNIVTSTIAFEADGAVREYVGGYEDWLRQRQAEEMPEATLTDETADKVSRKERNKTAAKTKLGYNEQRELDQLPGQIEQQEQALQQLEAQMTDPGFYQQDKQLIAATLAEVETRREQLKLAYKRWEQLDATG
jgi:ATP-binding cassette subfamily F protein uup